MSGEIWASMRSWRTQQMRCERSEKVPLGDKSVTLIHRRFDSCLAHQWSHKPNW